MAGVAINDQLFLDRLKRLHDHFIVSNRRQDFGQTRPPKMTCGLATFNNVLLLWLSAFLLQARKGDEAMYGGANALLIQHGKAVGEGKEEPHAVTLQKHLLGYEFPETIFMLTADTFVAHATQKKRKWDRCEGVVPAVAPKRSFTGRRAFFAFCSRFPQLGEDQS
jgi:FACT complex subunit SPT16 N-terminal lobe domain